MDFTHHSGRPEGEPIFPTPPPPDFNEGWKLLIIGLLMLALSLLLHFL